MSGTANDAGDGALDNAAADRLAAAAGELYGAEPDAFTGRRGELAAAARAAGDKAAAKAIGALRRPTRAAWVVNRLARSDPSAPAKLAELGLALRAAEQARDGARLRELSAARGALIDLLTAQALNEAGLPDPPSALRTEVAATLTAALADPEVAAAFAAGTLTRAVSWSGFGGADLGAGWPEAAEAAGDKSGLSWARGATGGLRHAIAPAGVVPLRAVTPAAAVAPSQGEPGPEDRAAAQAAAAASRAAEAAERLAREAAELAAQRRQKYADASRALASAVTVAADAGAEEDRVAAEVRELEESLIRARAQLAAARRRARHAEAAERRARLALDRLPPE